MDIQEIKDLLTQFDGSTLTEFDLRKGDFELYLNKNDMSRGAANVAPAAPVAAPIPTTAAPAPKAVVLDNESPAEKPTAQAAPHVEGTDVVSPLVGVVYLKPAPDKPNFKQVGDRVNKGDVLCIVEAMKVMNEITSDIAGELVEVLVDNEQIVEYNQPLFKVKEG